MDGFAFTLGRCGWPASSAWRSPRSGSSPWNVKAASRMLADARGMLGEVWTVRRATMDGASGAVGDTPTPSPEAAAASIADSPSTAANIPSSTCPPCRPAKRRSTSRPPRSRRSARPYAWSRSRPGCPDRLGGGSYRTKPGTRAGWFRSCAAPRGPGEEEACLQSLKTSTASSRRCNGTSPSSMSSASAPGPRRPNWSRHPSPAALQALVAVHRPAGRRGPDQRPVCRRGRLVRRPAAHSQCGRRGCLVGDPELQHHQRPCQSSRRRVRQRSTQTRQGVCSVTPKASPSLLALGLGARGPAP